MSAKEESKVSAKDKFDLAVQAGLQLIPGGIGGAISNIYFGLKQEKRFKRIERFYSELAEELKIIHDKDLKEMRDNIDLLNNYDKEAFAFIIEDFNDNIEREFTSQKVNIFKRYLKSTLKDPVTGENFDKRKFLLDAISAMSIIECEILGYIYNHNDFIGVQSVIKKGIDKYEILGAINRLKSLGFIITYQCFYVTDDLKGAETDFQENIEISSLGREFCEFCLAT